MHDKKVHLSDQDLLLFADGELSSHEANRMREHLSACWTCRARATELEGAIADFVQIQQGKVEARMRPAAGLRASLKAQLAVAAATEHKPRFRLFPAMFSHQLALGCVALLIVAAGVWRMGSGAFHSNGGVVKVQASALPDRTLTPGFTRDVKLGDLCGRRHADAPPAVDIATEQTVFKEYGLPVSTSKAYELDYLITPELGGADDVRNLWPEPYASTAWNAHVKDELENRLHEMVCDGQIDLSTAQSEIATNWIAAYKLHFHTDSPLPNAENVTSSGLQPKTDFYLRKQAILLAGRFSMWSLPQVLR
jgi:hypothetical protein